MPSEGCWTLFCPTVQLLNHVWLFETPWTAACQASLSSLSPGVFPNSCPLSQWCYPTILFSVSPLSYCPQSFLASGSFLMSWLFVSGGYSIGASAPVGHRGLKTSTQSSDYRQILWNPGDKWNSVQIHLLASLGYIYLTGSSHLPLNAWSMA